MNVDEKITNCLQYYENIRLSIQITIDNFDKLIAELDDLKLETKIFSEIREGLEEFQGELYEYLEQFPGIDNWRNVGE